MASSSAMSSASRAYSIPALSAGNYAIWSIRLEMLLIRSKLWSVVEGTEAAPLSNNSASLTTWKLKDAKAWADILLHYDEK